jgi:diguanylate cyclase (GGDEF)-like protein
MGTQKQAAAPSVADIRLLSQYPAIVRRRSYFFFVMVMLLGTALSVVVYLRTAQVTEVTMNLVDTDMPRLRNISDLRLAIANEVPILYEYYATRDRHAFQIAFEANQTRINRGFRQIRDVFAGYTEPAVIVAEHKALLQYAGRLDVTLKLTQTDWDLAREILAEISKRSTVINADLNRLVDMLQTGASKRGRHTFALVNNAVALVSAFSIVILVLTLIIGYYVNVSLAAAWQRRRLATFPERSPNPIVSLSLAGEVLYANPSAIDMAAWLHESRDVRVALFPEDLSLRLQALKNSDASYNRWEYVRGECVLGCGIHLLRDLELFHAFLSDITDRKRAEERLRHAAYHDTLTGLPNRRQFMEDLERALSAPDALPGAVLLINLDRFQSINECLGHEAGDLLLQAVATCIFDTALRASDLCSHILTYRFEGDVFAIRMEGLSVRAQNRAGTLASRLLEVFEAPLPVLDREIVLTISIGIVLIPEDAVNAVTALKHANSAIRQVKSEGGTGVVRYSSTLAAAAMEKLELEHGLRRALERKELFLLYQPQMDIRSGRIVGVEALIRWRHPSLGVISPVKFITIAEETGLIVEIGEWILRTACAQAHTWQRAGRSLLVSVNVSARQLLDAAFPQLVKEVVTAYGMPPGTLELEITETTAMRDVELTARILSTVQNIGVRVAIDDFGTGYSSLNYLRRFSVNKLKIDQAFIHNLTEDDDDAAIVQAIVELAHRLGVHVIAEGVETALHLDALRRYDCDEAQGYLIAKPIPIDALETLLTQVPGVSGKQYATSTA